MMGGIRDVWSRGGTPLAVLPTGGGKTFVFAELIREHGGGAVCIAHRRELVGQMSLALARAGVHHRIIAPASTIRMIIRNNIEEVGQSFYSPNVSVAVAGVDSISNAPEVWRQTITLWVIDEGHHIQEDNKWGRAIALFPNAKGLGVTATPLRADGKGLGTHSGGVFTEIVEGPSMRDLIDAGYLCEYKVYAPQSAIDLSGVKISSATGDYSAPQLRTAVEKASITGDVVAHYLKIAPGKLGVTFAVDVAAAQELADAYNAAGVPAMCVHAKTPGAERADALRRFARREILQLVNVDLFGEGFDLPALEVVSFARPTQSFPLYSQSFGRVVRIMEGKTIAIVIDHVGNVLRHRLPDAERTWSLDSRDRKSKAALDPLALQACPECAGVYRRIMVECPYCGHVPVPVLRSAPDQVAGDLVELDAETLAAMRCAEERVNRDPSEYAQELLRLGCPDIGIRGNVNRHKATQEAQARLRHAMDWWGGVHASEGLSERECYRLFYLTYGIDAASARVLTSKDADALCTRIRSSLPFAAQCL